MHFGNLNFGRNWQKSVSAKMVSTGLNHGFNWFKPLMLSRNMPTLGYFNPKLMTGRTKDWCVWTQYQNVSSIRPKWVKLKKLPLPDGIRIRVGIRARLKKIGTLKSMVPYIPMSTNILQRSLIHFIYFCAFLVRTDLHSKM